MKYIATVDGRDFSIDIERAGEVRVDDREHAVDLEPVDGAHLHSLILDNESFDLYVERREGLYYILIEGDRYAVDVEQARLKQLKALSGETHEEHTTAAVEAPMPGLVLRVLVEPGQEVEQNQGLVILEAMKMENEIRSPRAGLVGVVHVEDGQTVNLGDPLMVVGDPE